MSNLIAENRNDVAAKYQEKICNYIYLFTVPCICALIVWGRIVIHLFAGRDFDKAYPILCMLAITLFTVVTKNLYENCILLPNGQDKIILFSTALGAAINISFNAVLIPQAKGMGATVVSVASETIVVLSYTIYCRKNKIGKNIIEYIKPYLVGGLFIIFFWIFLREILDDYLCGAILTTLIGGIVYIGSLFLFRNTYLYGIIKELKRMRNRK